MKTNLLGISGKINSGKDTVGIILQGLSEGASVKNIVHIIENSSDNPPPGAYQIKKYADKLKDMVCLLIGCTRADLEDQDFKNKELGEEWVKFSVGKGHFTRIYYNSPREALVNLHLARRQEEGDWNYAVEEMTPRKLLQLLGTECGRNIIHPNIWINALFGDYTKHQRYERGTETVGLTDGETVVDYKIPNIEYDYPSWIITDVRFPDEVKAIEDRGGVVIRVNRLQEDKLAIELYAKNHPIGGKMLETYNKFNHPSETALDSHPFEIVVENNGTIQELVEKIRNLNLV